jgi:hypothetical protein
MVILCNLLIDKVSGETWISLHDRFSDSFHGLFWLSTETIRTVPNHAYLDLHHRNLPRNSLSKGTFSMTCRAFPEKVFAEWCSSRKSREWRRRTAEWGRWISKNIKKWIRRAHGGSIMVESEINEIGGWKSQRSRTKMMWNRQRSRAGSARPGEVAEDGVRDRGVSKNVKGNRSSLRLLDVMRETPAEGTGRSTDVE